ncbi:GAF and ANTAR domain-containing protein [Pseudonocardia endophytica]|uniref:GAF and ANTAR domain-containing protein n=1 Tax=Pseudonocardia endophytica TaxID=401976 RepID=UPI001FB25AA4|nr:GAF and ANTAR domain-containing protein [Pseudonocardia endophytica]
MNPDALVVALRDAARSLTADEGAAREVDATLDELVHLAIETIPLVEEGGISRTGRGTVTSGHATSEGVRRLDELQAELGEGPCVTAADDAPAAGIVVADDLAGPDAERWPRFAPGAVREGYRSLMSVQLTLHGPQRSALNLYAHEPGVFDESARLTAGLFGLQAAILLYGTEHAANLGHAVTTRDVIGQAKGILMERFTVDDQTAFRMLVNSSQDTNLKLVDVARWLTEQAVRAAENATTGEPRLPAPEMG